jgi:prophage regulatory protein
MPRPKSLSQEEQVALAEAYERTDSAGKPIRFIRMAELETRVGMKHTQINKLESSGYFPRRVKISVRATGWLESEIDEWIMARVAASRQPK